MKPKNDTRMTLRLPSDTKKDVYYQSKGKPNKWINEAIKEKLERMKK